MIIAHSDDNDDYDDHHHDDYEYVCGAMMVIILTFIVRDYDRVNCRFDSVTDLLEPVSDGREDQCFISKAYDATSHFETCANDVLSLYTRITGTELDMNISADMNDDES
jgi:hypothetical protein